VSNEIFEIDTELTRDAICAAIWSRLCSSIRGGEDGYRVEDYVATFAETTGDQTTVLDYLDEDTNSLVDAQQMLSTARSAELGAKVELPDIWRFMPKGWAVARNRWIYARDQIPPIEASGEHVERVRDFGTDEGLRRQ
jgi:hypothetical protein